MAARHSTNKVQKAINSDISHDIHNFDMLTFNKKTHKDIRCYVRLINYDLHNIEIACLKVLLESKRSINDPNIYCNDNNNSFLLIK